MSDETGETRPGRVLDADIAGAIGRTVEWQPNGTMQARLEPMVLCQRTPGVGDPTAGDYWWQCPRYSTDIAAAWQVVEAMRARGVYLDVCARRDGFYATAGWAGDDGDDIWREKTRDAETAPLAICRAALATLSTPTGPTR